MAAPLAVMTRIITTPGNSCVRLKSGTLEQARPAAGQRAPSARVDATVCLAISADCMNWPLGDQKERDANKIRARTRPFFLVAHTHTRARFTDLAQQMMMMMLRVHEIRYPPWVTPEPNATLQRKGLNQHRLAPFTTADSLELSDGNVLPNRLHFHCSCWHQHLSVAVVSLCMHLVVHIYICRRVCFLCKWLFISEKRDVFLWHA